MKDGKKILFVSHCILNQTARATGKQRSNGTIKELMELFSESGVGIVQLPCPEIVYNGVTNRKSKSKTANDTKSYRNSCKKLSDSLLLQIKDYLQKDYNVIGVLGVELSPTCAVHQLENGSKNVPGKGIFMEELETAMRKKNFQVPVIGVNLNNLYSSMEKLQNLLQYS